MKNLYLIVGPSGVGKTCLVDMLLADDSGQLVRPVTHTTRSPRLGELDGHHYHFRTRQEFEAMIAAGELVEHAEVHGNLYGTSKASLAAFEPSQKVLLIIDCEGAANVRRLLPASTSIFIMAPLAILRERMEMRGDGAEAIDRRLETAKNELQRAERDGFDHHITNIDKNEAYMRLKEIIMVSQ